jgi:nucleotide-binding universal stress UspA family protein
MPVFQSLLVPTDGSDQSIAACKLATSLASNQGASIAFLNVVEADKVIASVMPGQGYSDPGAAIEAMHKAGTQILHDAVAGAQATGVEATSQLAEGASVDTILSVAASVCADLIVIGSHGRGGLKRLMLGSVAEGVVRRSPIPVLIIKVGP